MASGVPMTYNVLIVDDSDDDRFFLRRAFRRYPRFAIIGELPDGEEAISYLVGRAPYSDRHQHPLPHLLLLDLKMPRRSGLEVLQWLHAAWIPTLTVVVLSSSILPSDVETSLALGAQAFWTKTANTEKQDNIAQEIEVLLDKRWRLWTKATETKASQTRSDSVKSPSQQPLLSAEHPA